MPPCSNRSRGASNARGQLIAPDALQMRASAHLEKDDLQAAEADINKALLLDGDNIDTLVLRGDIREAKRLAEED